MRFDRMLRKRRAAAARRAADAEGRVFLTTRALCGRSVEARAYPFV
jgi:hypothetical protein